MTRAGGLLVLTNTGGRVAPPPGPLESGHPDMLWPTAVGAGAAPQQKLVELGTQAAGCAGAGTFAYGSSIGEAGYSHFPVDPAEKPVTGVEGPPKVPKSLPVKPGPPLLRLMVVKPLPQNAICGEKSAICYDILRNWLTRTLS